MYPAILLSTMTLIRERGERRIIIILVHSQREVKMRVNDKKNYYVWSIKIYFSVYFFFFSQCFPPTG